MKSYIYPRINRQEIAEKYIDDTEARYARVNDVLTNTTVDVLAAHSLRRARQVPKVYLESFGVALEADAIQVIRSIPGEVSYSALIQWILSE